MAPLCHVSRGKTEEAYTGQRDYRHRARTGVVEKRQVAHWCLCDPHMQEHALRQGGTSAVPGATCLHSPSPLQNALTSIKHPLRLEPGQYFIGPFRTRSL